MRTDATFADVAWSFSVRATRAVSVQCAALKTNWLGSFEVVLGKMERQLIVDSVFKDFSKRERERSDANQ